VDGDKTLNFCTPAITVALMQRYLPQIIKRIP